MFDSLRCWRYRVPAFKHSDDLSHLSLQIPGISRHGHTISGNQTSMTIQRIFNPSYFFPRDFRESCKIVRWDPLFHFFNRIGIKNASRLTRIKLEGEFQSYMPEPDMEDYLQDSKYLDFPDFLRCYITIINGIGCNIRSLTLHASNLDSEILRDEDSMRRQDRINEAVKMLVERLPTLNNLQLGQYRFDERPHEVDQWGESIKWTSVIKERAFPQESKQDPTTAILNIEKGVNKFFGETREFFSHLPYKAEAWENYQYYESSYNCRWDARNDKKELKAFAGHPIWLGPELGNKPFKWMGRQYPRYRWSRSAGFSLGLKSWEKSPDSDDDCGYSDRDAGDDGHESYGFEPIL